MSDFIQQGSKVEKIHDNNNNNNNKNLVRTNGKVKGKEFVTFVLQSFDLCKEGRRGMIFDNTILLTKFLF